MYLKILFTFSLLIFLSTARTDSSDYLNRDEEFEDLLDFCPLRTCEPSIKFTTYDKKYYLKQLKTGDLDTFIQLMTKISSFDRQDINKEFFKKYSKNIEDVLKFGAFSFMTPIKSAISKMMKNPEYIFAEDLNYAIKHDDVELITEILFTVNNFGLSSIDDAYGELFRRSVAADINEHLKKNPLARNLLSMRAQEGRKSGSKVSVEKAINVAEFLQKRDSNWEVTFNTLLVKESANQLQLIFDTFERKYSTPIESFIKSHADKKMVDIYLSIVQMVRDPYNYLATRLYEAMAGFGTDDRDLCRIIIGRAEFDLASIEDAFDRLPEIVKRKTNLRSYVVSETRLAKQYSQLLQLILSNRATSSDDDDDYDD